MVDILPSATPSFLSQEGREDSLCEKGPERARLRVQQKQLAVLRNTSKAERRAIEREEERKQAHLERLERLQQLRRESQQSEKSRAQLQMTHAEKVEEMEKEKKTENLQRVQHLSEMTVIRLRNEKLKRERKLQARLKEIDDAVSKRFANSDQMAADLLRKCKERVKKKARAMSVPPSEETKPLNPSHSTYPNREHAVFIARERVRSYHASSNEKPSSIPPKPDTFVPLRLPSTAPCAIMGQTPKKSAAMYSDDAIEKSRRKSSVRAAEFRKRMAKIQHEKDERAQLEEKKRAEALERYKDPRSIAKVRNSPRAVESKVRVELCKAERQRLKEMEVNKIKSRLERATKERMRKLAAKEVLLGVSDTVHQSFRRSGNGLRQPRCYSFTEDAVNASLLDQLPDTHTTTHDGRSPRTPVSGGDSTNASSNSESKIGTMSPAEERGQGPYSDVNGHGSARTATPNNSMSDNYEQGSERNATPYDSSRDISTRSTMRSTQSASHSSPVRNTNTHFHQGNLTKLRKLRKVPREVALPPNDQVTKHIVGTMEHSVLPEAALLTSPAPGQRPSFSGTRSPASTVFAPSPNQPPPHAPALQMTYIRLESKSPDAGKNRKTWPSRPLMNGHTAASPHGGNPQEHVNWPNSKDGSADTKELSGISSSSTTKSPFSKQVPTLKGQWHDAAYPNKQSPVMHLSKADSVNASPKKKARRVTSPSSANCTWFKNCASPKAYGHTAKPPNEGTPEARVIGTNFNDGSVDTKELCAISPNLSTKSPLSKDVPTLKGQCYITASPNKQSPVMRVNDVSNCLAPTTPKSKNIASSCGETSTLRLDPLNMPSKNKNPLCAPLQSRANSEGVSLETNNHCSARSNRDTPTMRRSFASSANEPKKEQKTSGEMRCGKSSPMSNQLGSPKTNSCKSPWHNGKAPSVYLTAPNTLNDLTKNEKTAEKVPVLNNNASFLNRGVVATTRSPNAALTNVESHMAGLDSTNSSEHPAEPKQTHTKSLDATLCSSPKAPLTNLGTATKTASYESVCAREETTTMCLNAASLPDGLLKRCNTFEVTLCSSADNALTKQDKPCMLNSQSNASQNGKSYVKKDIGATEKESALSCAPNSENSNTFSPAHKNANAPSCTQNSCTLSSKSSSSFAGFPKHSSMQANFAAHNSTNDETLPECNPLYSGSIDQDLSRNMSNYEVSSKQTSFYAKSPTQNSADGDLRPRDNLQYVGSTTQDLVRSTSKYALSPKQKYLHAHAQTPNSASGEPPGEDDSSRVEPRYPTTLATHDGAEASLLKSRTSSQDPAGHDLSAPKDAMGCKHSLRVNNDAVTASNAELNSKSVELPAHSSFVSFEDDNVFTELESHSVWVPISDEVVHVSGVISTGTPS